MMMKTVRLRPPGLAGASGCSGASGEDLADRWAVSRSIVVAMSSLIAWVRNGPGRQPGGPLMKRPGDAGGARQRDPGGSGGEAGVDLGVARADQPGLRGDDVDVAGDPGLETLARLAELTLGEPQLLAGHRLLRLGRAQVEQGGIHLGGDLAAQVRLAHLRLAYHGVLLGEPRLAPEAVENRHAHLQREVAGGDRARHGRAVHAVIAGRSEERRV